jgi:hypothetical protein
MEKNGNFLEKRGGFPSFFVPFGTFSEVHVIVTYSRGISGSEEIVI